MKRLLIISFFAIFMVVMMSNFVSAAGMMPMVPATLPPSGGPTPTPPPPTGEVDISSTPAGAEFFVDGSGIAGVTPGAYFLQYGTHTITVKLYGYQDWSTTVDVESSGPYTINAELTWIGTLTFDEVYSQAGQCNLYGICSPVINPILYKNQPYQVCAQLHDPYGMPYSIPTTITITELPYWITAHSPIQPTHNETHPVTVTSPFDRTCLRGLSTRLELVMARK